MRAKTANTLDEILQDHRTRQTQQRRRAARERSAPEQLRQRWDNKVEGTLLAVWEEFRDRLIEQGHLCSISVEEVKTSTDDIHYGTIALLIAPAKYRGEELLESETPALIFELDPDRRIAQLTRRTILGRRGGTEGLNGEFTLKEVTRSLVEEKTLALIREVF